MAGQMEVMKSCGPVYRSHKSSLPFTAIREVDVLISVCSYSYKQPGEFDNFKQPSRPGENICNIPLCISTRPAASNLPSDYVQGVWNMLRFTVEFNDLQRKTSMYNKRS